MGILTPPMLEEAIAGKMPWSDVAAFMLYLAFLGTISGMVVMSLNYPFIFHTVSYTLSAVWMAFKACKDKKMVKQVKEWRDRVSHACI